MVKRVERYAANGGMTTNAYDLTRLVESLKKFEPEFRKVEDKEKSERKAVEKSGYKPKPFASAS